MSSSSAPTDQLAAPADQRPELRPGRRTGRSRPAWSVASAKPIASAGDRQRRATRHQQHHARARRAAGRRAQQLDPAPEERRRRARTTIAQPNIAPVGRSNGGRPGIASENVPKPVSESRPEEDQRADAGGEQPGHEHDAEHRAAEPGGLEQQERAEQRRAEQRADRGEAAGGGDHRRGRSAARRARRGARPARPSPLPIRISGASGPSTTPKPSVAERGEDDPGQLAGRQRARRP